MTNTRTPDEEIWKWYQHLEKCNSTGSTIHQYCRDNNLDIKEYYFFSRRIKYIKDSKPVLYMKLIESLQEFESTDMTLKDYAKTKNIKKWHLEEVRVHLCFLESIERMKNNSPEQKMTFIKAPTIIAKTKEETPPSDGEVIVKQNDIEINISKGVKVCIAPNVESIKIIKIIELLKDL